MNKCCTTFELKRKYMSYKMSNQIFASPGNKYPASGVNNWVFECFPAIQSVPQLTDYRLILGGAVVNTFPDGGTYGLTADVSGVFTCHEDMVLHISATLRFVANGAGVYRQYGIVSPDGPVENGIAVSVQPPSTTANAEALSVMKRFSAGDTFSIIMGQDSGGDLAIDQSYSRIFVTRIS